jgi:4'-phosphopantetheinyl transferase
LGEFAGTAGVLDVTAGTDLEMFWPRRSEVEPIMAGDVHVWAAALDVSPKRLEQLKEVLSRDEHERGARFRNPDIARRWLTGRGLLRELLGEYVGVEPTHIRFAYDAHAKPGLAEPMPRSSVQFNISHAGGLALYAFSHLPAVGVDTEQLIELCDLPDISKRFFSRAECARLVTVSPGCHTLAFYCYWTRKEAYLKARGLGLLAPLDNFDVSGVPGERAALLHVQGDPDAPARWSLFHLNPAAGYVGALAVEARNPRVSCETWAR